MTKRAALALAALALSLSPVVSNAADKVYMETDGKTIKVITKVEALTIKLTQPERTILACAEQVVSDKATLKAK